MKSKGLRSNKGYTGIDISIAMIIILIFVPTIFGIVYNLQKSRIKTEREATAVGIAVDILEIARSLNYNDLNLTEGEFKTILDNKYEVSSQNSNTENDAYYTFIKDNDNRYKIQVSVLKYTPENISNTDDFVKQVKVIVTYPIENTTNSIDISTVIQNKL